MHVTPKTITRTVIQGEFETSNDPNVCLSAILGSCVSICIFDVQAGVGGMNHFLRPGDTNDAIGDKKYGIHAVELLINNVLRLGGKRSKLQAKVFGGANINPALGNMGTQNSDFALVYLDVEGIPIISESVGGPKARRVRFWPHSGLAQQRFVQDAVDRNIEKSVISYRPTTVQSVELF